MLARFLPTSFAASAVLAGCALARCVLAGCVLAGCVLAGCALAGCDGNSGVNCPCFPCGAAIELRVVNAAGDPVANDWTVEAALDGNEVDTSACTPGARNGLNTCGFGLDTGVYDVVVRTPREERELKARFAGRAGQNCCNCLPLEPVQVVLEQE